MHPIPRNALGLVIDGESAIQIPQRTLLNNSGTGAQPVEFTPGFGEVSHLRRDRDLLLKMTARLRPPRTLLQPEVVDEARMIAMHHQHLELRSLCGVHALNDAHADILARITDNKPTCTR